MRNYVQHGDIVDLTAPQPAGVVSGEGFLTRDLFGVASTDAKPGQKVSTWLEGVFQLPKASGTGLTEGQRVYWDADEKNVTATETDNAFIGHAVESVLAAAVFVPVRLAR
jgi:predicted RecA/RadA family phage recombinase